MSGERQPAADGEVPAVDRELYALDRAFTRMAEDAGNRIDLREVMKRFGLDDGDLIIPDPAEAEKLQKDEG